MTVEDEARHDVEAANTALALYEKDGQMPVLPFDVGDLGIWGEAFKKYPAVREMIALEDNLREAKWAIGLLLAGMPTKMVVVAGYAYEVIVDYRDSDQIMSKAVDIWLEEAALHGVSDELAAALLNKNKVRFGFRVIDQAIEQSRTL